FAIKHRNQFGRKSGVQQNAQQQIGGPWGLVRGLENNAVAGRDRRPDLVPDRVQRRIERRYRNNHAERMKRRVTDPVPLPRRALQWTPSTGQPLGLLAGTQQGLHGPVAFAGGVGDGKTAVGDYGVDQFGPPLRHQRRRLGQYLVPLVQRQPYFLLGRRDLAD